MMILTARTSKDTSKMPVEKMDFLDLATKNMLDLLRTHNAHRDICDPHIVFRYTTDCCDRYRGYDGTHIMDQNLMFFGLEKSQPGKNAEEKDPYYKAAKEIVEHLSKGECIYPGAGCEIRTLVKGKFDNLKVVATLLNGWKTWQFEAKNQCSYEEMKWTIEELNYLGMLPHEVL